MIISNHKITVNEYFDHVYLLNLDRRPDKLKKVSIKLEKFNIKFERFAAIDGSKFDDNYKLESKLLGNHKCIIGCLLSHINIIKDAKDKNYKRILIFEDDIMISEKFNEYFQKVKELDDWKLLYLGASQHNWENLKTDNGFYIANNTFGSFAYGIKCTIFDDILNACKHYNPIDAIYTKNIHINHKSYVFYPNIVIADVSDSDIRNARDNKTHGIKMRWNILNDYI